MISILLATTTALAQPSMQEVRRPREVRLQYSVPFGAKDCPDEEAFKARVRMRAGFDPFVPDAPARLVVTIVPAERPGRFRGRFELRDSTGGLLYERDYLPEHCPYVAAAAAIGVSLQLNREPPAAPSSSAEPPNSTEAPESMALPEPSAKQVPAQARPAAPPVPRRHEKIDRRAPRKATHPLVGIYGGGSMVLWMAPVVVAGQVLAGVSLQWPDFYVALEGQGQLPASAAVGASPTITFSRGSGGPVICGVWRYLHGCALAQVGAVHASTDAPTPRSDAGVGVWAGGRIVLRQSLHPRVALGVFTDVQVALRRPVIQFNHERIWEAPRVSLSLGLSLGTFF